MSEFPGLRAEIDAAIAELGGCVAPKFSWSSPHDATWVSADHSLGCSSADEVGWSPLIQSNVKVGEQAVGEISSAGAHPSKQDSIRCICCHPLWPSGMLCAALFEQQEASFVVVIYGCEHGSADMVVDSGASAEHMSPHAAEGHFKLLTEPGVQSRCCCC